ncbi:PREDICTED: abscisic acid receptor PYL4-like [Ipomoea nil]|uniref:abscisic acid receptor PYL4-like n=1 Tax=Ipomoea nil TaxID=35883 RepID=UPI00090164EA|nr:PREDICTED: abscisic acid receptor PYL4-like [Ipomoea nil]
MPTTVHCHIADSHHHLSAAVTAAAAAASIHKQPLPTWTVLLPDSLLQYHIHAVGPNQCCSAVVQEVSAPLDAVWALVRRFDNPQAYKHFLKSCHVVVGDGSSVGTLREVRVVSGVPAVSSTERLDILDDERHVFSFSVVGGDHRLHNYRSVTTLHHAAASPDKTIVVESFVVDVPPGNTKEETCVFVDTIVRCNLQSLAHIAENSGQNLNIVKSSCN